MAQFTCLRRRLRFASFLLALLTSWALAQTPDLQVTNSSGIRMAVDSANTLPALKVLLPGQADSDPGIFILFPEHVTVRRSGDAPLERLYLYRPAQQSQHIEWRKIGNALEYQMDLGKERRVVARATLEADGIRYRYQFINLSKDDYAMFQAVTDPRMITPYLHDTRLERTYVHHANGFDLLASETPARISMPLNQWLPNRYRASYTWPVERDRVARQPDGLTWYNKSRAVDEPMLATRSTDGKWIMATFSYDPGNVWVNPELTCQHADPQIALRPGETRAVELKTLFIQGTLDQALERERAQRGTLAH